jgi:thioredoxin 1
MMTARHLVILACVAMLMLFVQTGESAGIDNAVARAKAEGKVVMLELGSVGCIPCEQMKPVMERLSKEYAGRLEVIFVDVKKDVATGRKYGVHAIPTQVFLDKSGKEFHRHIGFYAYKEIVPVLKRAGI